MLKSASATSTPKSARWSREADNALVQRLGRREFEFQPSWLQQAYYAFERSLGHRLLRRPPPTIPGDRLLNLGCGPHIFSGWVNADDYALKRTLREPSFRPNWRLDIGRPWLCPDDYWDGIFSQHVLEMLPYSRTIVVAQECLRTLKPGAKVRIVLPDFRKYLAGYLGQETDFPPLPHPLLWVSDLTQMHLARSTWDADLFMRVLSGVGFEDVQEVDFLMGTDERLFRDGPEKRMHSFYVEARKPLR